MNQTNTQTKKERRILLFLVLFSSFVLLFSLVLSLFPVHGEGAIYDSVLRLHVIANSDTEEDQALKLLVRDAVIEAVAPLLTDCLDLEDVCRTVSGSADIIEEAAKATVAENGYDYPINVELGREKYPRKSYADVCFPAGEYLSLQVKIGDAAGQNWWCVLFPPLCLASATVKDDMESGFISVGLTDDQYKIITETDNVKYRARFKILEVLESIFG